MITCISEASGAVQETLRTLRFTMSAARIRNHPVRFLDPQEKLILELREEIKRLRIENQHLREVNLSSSASSSRSRATSGAIREGGSKKDKGQEVEEDGGQELRLLSDEDERRKEEAKGNQTFGCTKAKDSPDDSEVLFVKFQQAEHLSPMKRTQVLPPPSLCVLTTFRATQIIVPLDRLTIRPI